ncbi:tRNA1(Val) A37 N6-methylase TrmN6 [Salinihabitans flavidus]|uniref:tRNA1(Val) A37 N6-methylase TrmN6 n=1 Tax=Salinihabitans flavidus TaxID=569882 RepID=A0A1H8SW09_9RHOB|nr:methyltransferase [Salinihabitans flavidus]SEO82852.1 tRNA1(Val) A37 N6-methylase TrmN6 [Salinihabitans flavidus]
MTFPPAPDPRAAPAAAITENGFLGGRLRVRQPARGYRAGVDPVLLAASVPARAGQSVLELGCGVGTALLCLGARVPGLSLTGVEVQPGYAALARENAALNGVEMVVEEADLAALPPDLRQRRFNHVIANPPYFSRTASTPAQDTGREVAMGEATPLAAWVEVAARRLAPKGHASFIHRAERLPDLLAALSARLGSVEVIPLLPRAGRAASLVICRARKGGRAAFRLHAGVVMHAGDRHDEDRESYTLPIRAVLRDGAALPLAED